MADNSLIPTASGNEVFANKEIGGVKHPKHIQVDGTGAEIAVATSAKQDTANTALADILSQLVDPASETTLAAVLAALNGNLAIDPTSLADPYSKYVYLPESTTVQLGAAGAAGDYLAGIVFTPLSADCGQVTYKDGTAGSSRVAFAGGGTVALPSLYPFTWAPGATAKSAGGWYVTMPAGIVGIATGNFTDA